MRRRSLGSVVECYRGSGGVRVFRLDREAILSRLRGRALALLKDDPDVLEVRLFGSLARNTAGPGSDADLLVVSSASELPFLERSSHYARAFGAVGVGCDVFAYTLAELEGMRRDGNGLIRSADAEGLLLALRGPTTR